MNVLITGANRGIGAEFVKHYLSQGAQVWACYRNNLGQLATIDNPNLTCLQWDVSAEISSEDRAKLPESINLLINNAGIYGAYGNGQNLESVTSEDMLSVFQVNSVAPLMVVQQLLPALKIGANTEAGATIANMSSKMGSVEDNSSGGTYAYRASKSALCIISRSMAHDLAECGIQAICLHPGWVKTDMTHNTGLISAGESVAGLTKVIRDISHYPEGSFVAYDGQVVPF